MVLRKSSVLARLSTKWSIEPCGELNRLVGFNASGAWTLLLRSGMLAMMPASILVLSRSDVLHTLRNRPAIRSDLEIPLRIRKTLGRIEDIFSCGFEELQGLVLVPVRELLRPGRPGTEQYKSATNNESQRSRNALHN